MQQNEFISLLISEGYDAPVIVERTVADALDEHSHPFEAKALILSGDLTITTASGPQHYQAGDVFHLYEAVPHSEVFGQEGVRYLVGRRHSQV